MVYKITIINFYINQQLYIVGITHPPHNYFSSKVDLTMEDFAAALNDVHDKLCKGDIVHREPSYVLLPEEEYPVSVVEFEEMFELMVKVCKKKIQEDEKLYYMIQDVISCMRDTGMMDSYLFLSFERGEKASTIEDTFSTGVIRVMIKENVYETRDGKLFFIEDRVDTITTMMYIRDPIHVEKDNERYEDIYKLLNTMMISLKSIKGISDRRHEKEKNDIEKKNRDIKTTGQGKDVESYEDEADTSGVSDFATALNNVHDKLCKGDIVHREPSYVRLPKEEYPVSVVEFEEMFELMVEVPREEIREDKIYGMIQDVISCMRDTGMMDSYLYLAFDRGDESYIIEQIFSVGLIRGIIKDVYETRDDKLFFFEDRVDTITTMMSIRDPKHLEEDNKRYGDMNDMLMRMMISLKSIKNIFDQKHEKEKEKEKNDTDKKN